MNGSRINRRYLSGVSYMLFSSLLIATLSLLTKHLSVTVDLMFLIFLSFFLPALLMWWMRAVTHAKVAKVADEWTLFYRTFFSVAAQYCLFYYLTHGSVLNGTLLYMTSPLFMPLIARVYMDHKISRHVWYALVVGFVGVACVIKPDQGIINKLALIGLASGFLNGCAQVVFHKLSKHADTFSITTILYTTCSMLALFPLILYGEADHIRQVIDPVTHGFDWVLLVALTFVGVSNQFVRIKAYSKVRRAAVLTPFMYTTIVFAGVYDWLFYGLLPDKLSLLGIILIVGSGLLISWPRRFRRTIRATKL